MATIVDKFQPHSGLAQDPVTLNAIQNTGSSHQAILYREVADGVLPTIKTLETSQIPTGVTDIHGVSQIGLAYSFTKGSLTDGRLEFEWGVRIGPDDSRLWFSQTSINLQTTLLPSPKNPVFIITATGTGIIHVTNPGANWVRVYAYGNGTATSSSMLLYLVRGWGNSYNQKDVVT